MIDVPPGRDISFDRAVFRRRLFGDPQFAVPEVPRRLGRTLSDADLPAFRLGLYRDEFR